MSESNGITRRSALGRVAGAASLAAAAAAALPAEQQQEIKARAAGMQPLKLKGRIKQSVCRWCYQKIPLEDLAKAAAEMGLVGVDLLTPEEWPVVQRLGLIPTMGYVSKSNTIPDGLNDKNLHAKLEPEFHEGIDKAAAAGVRNVICFSGNRKGMSDWDGLENCYQFLTKVVKHAEDKNVTLHMELLNSKINHKDYMCDKTPWGVELVKRVGSPNFKLLYDIYHMQIDEGDVIRTIRDNKAYLNHYHTGGVPGRNEIDESQELYYPAVVRAIIDTGFTGYMAHEFIPKREPLVSLREAALLCDV